MNVLKETKRLKMTMFMITWICLIFPGFHIPLTLLWADQDVQQFQGVIMETDPKEEVIYVNEKKIHISQGTKITTAREVRRSFESLRPKQWVFIRTRLEREHLVADRIVLIPRYIPPREMGKYRFMRTEVSK